MTAEGRGEPASALSALIVASDVQELDLYRDALAPELCDLECAKDAREALVKAIAHHPRVVVTDIHLRLFDGGVLCSLLRSDPLTAGVRIVVITADSPSQIKRAEACGADCVLTKPIRAEALRRAVHGAGDAEPR
jgi:CheY-like chemotaxis protein